MRLRIANLVRVILLAAFALGGEVQSRSDEEVSPHWIYFRLGETYVYLLRFATISDQERSFFRFRAYEFFFRYWVLHRSQYAKLPPVQRFEQDFARLLKNHACAFVHQDDPLSIRSYYKDGAFVPKPFPKVEGLRFIAPESARLPQVEGLPSKTLKTWAGYQKLVSAFRTFLQASAIAGSEPPTTPRDTGQKASGTTPQTENPAHR